MMATENNFLTMMTSLGRKSSFGANDDEGDERRACASVVAGGHSPGLGVAVLKIETTANLADFGSRTFP